MDLSKSGLPPELIKTLDAIFSKLRRIDANLTESQFIEQVFREWLEPYKRTRVARPRQRKEVVLENNLKTAFKLCRKSQAQVAREIGVDRAYLNHIINGKYEPSITLAFLLADALSYPPEKINDLFFLRPALKE